MMAWKKKVKTLYYLRSEASKRAETVSDEALRQYIFDSIDDEGCLACEG
jgi:ribonucleotide reductase alpha subunit